MSFPFSNNLSLSKEIFTKSIYPKNAVLNEFVNIICLYSIIQNSENVKYTEDHPQSKLYGSIHDQLNKYKALFDEINNCFNISLSLPKHGWGRQNPDRQLGLAVFHRPHRHSLAKNIYDDYDMVNAQPEVYNQILKQTGQQFECLTYYCENREPLLNEIVTHYKNKIKTDDVKKMIIAMMNGGEFIYQCKKYAIETCDNHHPFLIQFSQQMPSVIDLVYHHNSHIADDVAKEDPDRFKGTDANILLERKRCVAGLFYTTIERHIQEICISYLVENKGFNLLNDIVPSQDGLMVKKQLSYPELIPDLEREIITRMGFPIKIKNKPFAESFEFPLLTNNQVDEMILKYNEECKIQDNFIEAEVLGNSFQTANVISKTLKDKLILCKENWYMLTDSNLWKQQKEPAYYIIEEIRKYIDKSNTKIVYKIAKTHNEDAKKKLIATSEKYLKAYSLTITSSYLNTLTKCLKTLLVDDTFEDKLDNNVGMLAFQNGIWDLKNKEFRQGIYSSDCISRTIPYDYKHSDVVKKSFVKSVLLKILNNNPEHLEYFLSIIGYSFIGNPELEKSIYFGVDKTTKSSGDNGKTFFFDILTHLFPNYVYKTKGSFLEAKNPKVHKQLAMMKGMRIVWLDEFGKNKTNAVLMKEIGDGLKIENEVMFGTSTTINIMFKLFALTNNMPSIDADEDAVYNRYKQISYASHFDRTGNRKVENPAKLEFIANTSLSGLLKAEYCNEIFDIVIDYAHSYFKKKIPAIPDQFISDTKETKKNNDSFMAWFDDNCEIDVDGRIPLLLIVNEYNLKEKDVKDGMKRMGFKYNKDLSKMGKTCKCKVCELSCNAKPYKGGFEGVKLIEEEKE